MYSTDTTILGNSRGSAAAWFALVRDRGAKRLDEVARYLDEVYRLAPDAGIRAEVAVVQAIHETDSFTSHWWNERLNSAGIGITGDANQNSASKHFGNGVEAARAQLVHLYLYAGGRTLPAALALYRDSDPRWDAAVNAGYAGRATTLGGLTNTWAVDSLYGDKLANHLNTYFKIGKDTGETSVEGSAPMSGIGKSKLRIAAGVGHANTSGGNPYELRKNRQVMAELIRLVEDSDGFELYCWTPNDGQGTFPGPLDDAAAQVRTKVAQGWLPHLVTEVHHQGLSNPNPRGGFTIHPDARGLRGRNMSGNPNFIDIDVRDAAAMMTKKLTSAIGVPAWGTGVMSERSTGVGGQGYRLGFFGAVSDPYFASSACVFITEAATFTNPTDRRIMDAPGFAADQARGLLEAYAHLAKTEMGWTYDHSIGGGGKKVETEFTIGDQVNFQIDGDLHTGPEFPDPIMTISQGTEATLINGPRLYGGELWWDTRAAYGSGWVLESALKKDVIEPDPEPVRDTYEIKELVGFEDTPVGVIPGEIYFSVEGTKYRAVFVGDRVEAAKDVNRYRTLALDENDLNGQVIRSGTGFDVKWLISPVAGGKSVYMTPWRTFVPVESTNRVGDIWIDYR